MTPIRKSLAYTIKLPDEDVQSGPGTVPSAPTSAATTSIADISKQFEKVSELGVFREPEEGLENDFQQQKSPAK